ncbi:MAG: (d)CMP kinase [Pelotomaculum sp.]|uniref:Cytidylate kinase n=1 Tax=Pelotomaculum thermopropionicum (strain DSM 13744 / JCM 10971 / SI) TaxID=370438 RepID=KCY_PELTS|nr:RecName: Full=Cytidylate kinase; Short=CK; AltName: Full=Cytidine monophosphate kinase; Short=CMP kinase [Pelotomaculum thermopropionicum SI]NPV74382.1 (d)CMP kinase [Pelotomaculum sp.]BAF59798.1 cytidylate kinase [Pelotomaculum thermopropionicum SI]
MNSFPNIAIDGPAGAGKSTVARLLSKELGFLYIDTGAMYRAVALKAIRKGVDLADQPGLSRLAAVTSVNLKTDAEGNLRVFLDGEDVTEEIRSPAVSKAVSLVARVPAVRERLVELQRAMASGGGVVMEGRDIGTVVLPDAEIKIFLTASPEERARRRREELAARGYIVDQHQMVNEITERDRIDTTRAAGPLVPAADAEIIDCSSMPVEKVVKMIVARVSAGRRE